MLCSTAKGRAGEFGTGYSTSKPGAWQMRLIGAGVAAELPAAPRLFSVAAEDALKNAAISFMLPPDDPQPGEFTAAITATGLSGTFSGTGERIELKRKDSYWQ